MMHMSTELKYVNPQIGYGVFATSFIPAGTIVYVQCALDRIIPPDSPLLIDKLYRDILLKYAFTDPAGNEVLCWDLGKYVNHCCHCNTLSTAYDFDIAICDIQAGEEITDDYALFTFNREMDLACHYPDCRGRLATSDFDQYWSEWDETVKEALQHVLKVEQPLLKYLDGRTSKDLMEYLTTGTNYHSLRGLRPISFSGV